MIVLGIEGTAHTFGCSLIDEKGSILGEAKDSYKPPEGWGIHPSEAANHHRAVAAEVLQRAFDAAKQKFDYFSLSDVEAIAYSAGPGLPPCLKATLEFSQAIARKYGKRLIPVNHPVGHIEIAKLMTGASDPVVLYVSGGNTQVIAYAAKKYRVFGETLDISIGNCIDTFIREAGLGYPGGPIFDELARKGTRFLELPYVVKGMDTSFSGLLTAGLQKLKQGEKLENACYSMQETAYAMLVEITERAMAHAGKGEALVTGGVAASAKLNEMMRVMCEERNAKAYACPLKYSGDNGTMIAWVGALMLQSGFSPLKPEKCDFDSKWRTDQAEITWIE
jgi:N6-L-threonylcarbamoyladenine synthase/protein kinase Bud32